MRIYVSCLASYNAGKLHGTWIDLDTDSDGVFDEIKAMLRRSPEPGAEEWRIDDTDGVPYTWGIDLMCEVARMVNEDHAPLESVVAYIGHVGLWSVTAETIADMFNDAFAGQWESEAEFAEEYAHDTCDMSAMGWLAHCIDWDHAWRELINDYWSAKHAYKRISIFHN